VTGIFGQVLDPARVEQAVKATLQAWLRDHLANQERENDRQPGSLPYPRSWPTISAFETRKHEQLPAIVIVSPGTAEPPTRHEDGRIDAKWRVEVAAVLSGKDEETARKLASMYVAAIVSALEQNPTLDGFARASRWVGFDQEYGTTSRGDQRAIYAALFEVDIRGVLNARLGPTAPSPDATRPPAPQQTYTDTEITVTPEELTTE
jgi:hypothetical protein